jgi:hypothetical protein
MGGETKKLEHWKSRVSCSTDSRAVTKNVIETTSGPLGELADMVGDFEYLRGETE